MVAGAKVWSSGAWVDAVGSGSALPQANVSATSGSPATGTFTDSNGIAWNYYKFTSSGSITFDSAGYADVLVVGGGGGSIDYGAGRYSGGGAGGLRFGLHYMPAGEHTITIGSGGAGLSGEGTASDGNDTSLGSIIIAGGGQGSQSPGSSNKAGVDYGGGDGGRNYTGASNVSSPGGGAGSGSGGLILNYDGFNVEYSKGGTFDTAVANTGTGGDMNGSRTGSSGIVIVKTLA